MRRVIVVPYDAAWPAAFEAEARAVAAAMGENLVAIHHIGSTSVAALHAKPVIDMLPVVADIAAVDRRAAAMQALGYEAMGEFGIAGRRYFRRDNAAGQRTHQVHAFQVGSPHIERHLAFRDYLRAHPAVAARYGALKSELAAAHPHDIEAYMDGKDAFIKETEAAALIWMAGRAATSHNG
jgi:GrpB-like predicted nucleotidyltransferase (UPF0157 family)